MDKQIELSQTEIELAFASFCIEGTARKLGQPYQEVFARMKRVGMIENYILPNYNILHTESREHVIDNIDVTYFRLFNIPDSLSELYNLRSTDLYLRPNLMVRESDLEARINITKTLIGHIGSDR